ncbi:MAG TPA: hypothetical protein GX393_06125 [Firmicutes bacterium]|jgi:Ni,Fe-hydrogenase I cytochrome b subunit|nr:hypothetical protein [Bacillota bacterium]
MRKHLVKSLHSFWLTRGFDGTNRQVETYLNLERHPRQKNQNYPPIVVTPLTFF